MSVLVVGESLVDVVVAADGTRREHVGGSALNVAVALARLGRPVCLATSWGDDERGARIAARLADEGVHLACDPVALERTSTAVAYLGSDGAATYDFDLEWRLNELPEAHFDAVHVGSIGAVLDPGAAQVQKILDDVRAPVFYDLNIRPTLMAAVPDLRARVEEIVWQTSVVKASDEDLAVLYPEDPLEDAILWLLALQGCDVVVTMAAAGATWQTLRSGGWDVPALPVRVVDTIGAGDTFSAALVDGWLRHDEPPVVLAHAASAAAVTVSRAGADPPYLHELRPEPGPGSA